MVHIPRGFIDKEKISLFLIVGISGYFSFLFSAFSFGFNVPSAFYNVFSIIFTLYIFRLAFKNKANYRYALRIYKSMSSRKRTIINNLSLLFVIAGGCILFGKV